MLFREIHARSARDGPAEQASPWGRDPALRASDWLQIGQIWVKPASSSAHSAPHAVIATTADADAAAAAADAAALGVIPVQGGVLLLPCRLQVAGRRSRLLHVDA